MSKVAHHVHIIVCAIRLAGVFVNVGAADLSAVADARNATYLSGATRKG